MKNCLGSSVDGRRDSSYTGNAVREGRRNILSLPGEMYKLIKLKQFINRNKPTELENQLMITEKIKLGERRH